MFVIQNPAFSSFIYNFKFHTLLMILKTGVGGIEVKTCFNCFEFVSSIIIFSMDIIHSDSFISDVNVHFF